jgi:hypothetical protein
MSEGAPETSPDTGLDQRVSQLETGQQSILSKLDQLLTGNGEPAQAEPGFMTAEDTAAMIRKQLAARDRAKPAEPAQPAAPSAAELAEKAPKAPVRRVTKLIWGDGD